VRATAACWPLRRSVLSLEIQSLLLPLLLLSSLSLLLSRVPLLCFVELLALSQSLLLSLSSSSRSPGRVREPPRRRGNPMALQKLTDEHVQAGIWRHHFCRVQ